MLEMFASDPDQEKNGIWLDYGNGTRIKMARAGGANEKFKRTMTAKMKPHKRLLDSEQMPDDLAEKIMHEVYAQTVVLDWEGVAELDGTAIPYTHANVISVFERFPAFFQDIIEQAGKLSMFQVIAEELAEKN
tara:strand:- start:1658 stop:2056 length:399 start_codon:yes stop_codon:yes gene_type:complete